MLADLFLIEMLQTTIARIMQKFHDKHDFRFGHNESTVIFALCGRLKRNVITVTSDDKIGKRKMQ